MDQNIGAGGASAGLATFRDSRKMSISAPALNRLMVVPAILFMLAIFYYPLMSIIGVSFNAPDFSLGHYQRFLSSETMLVVLRRTFVYAAAVTGIALVLGYPLAVFISRMVKQGRTFVLVLVLLPYLTSLLVRTYAWMILLSDHGMINSVLLNLGIIERPLTLLYTTFGAMVGMVHLVLPIMVLPIYAIVHGMNPEQMRAAKALGGGPLRSFFSVFLPQTLPGLKAGCILVFAISLGFYITPAALGGPSDLLLANIIARLLETLLDFGYASAISMILLLATIAVYILSGGGLGSVVKGDNEGADKGKSRSLGTLVGGLGKALANAEPVVRLQKWLWDRNMGRSAGRGIPLDYFWYALSIFLLLFLVLPSVIVVVMSFNAGDTLRFPPSALSMRWYESFFSNQTMMTASLNSIVLATGVALLSLVLGGMAAYALVRGKLPGTQILYGLLLAPIIVPSIVAAVGTYKVFADWGIVGTSFGVLLAHTPGSLAYVVIILAAVFMGLDKRLEMASASLGASRLRTMFLIVLPLVAPGILGATIFAFIHSFDEVVITSFIAGIFFYTLPQQIWLTIQHYTDPMIAAISTLVMILPIIALPFARARR